MSPAAAPETLVCDTSIVSMLRYASVRPQALAIERSGRPCGDNDLWIAATARTRDATVVTADKHFLPLADHVDVLYLKRKPDSSVS